MDTFSIIDLQDIYEQINKETEYQSIAKNEKKPRALGRIAGYLCLVRTNRNDWIQKQEIFNSIIANLLDVTDVGANLKEPVFEVLCLYLRKVQRFNFIS